MGDFNYVRPLNGMIPQLEKFVAGGACEVGDMLIWSSGKVVKAGDAATKPNVIAGLAMQAAAADGSVISVMPIVRDALIEGLVKDSTIPNVGAALHVDVTSNVMKFEGAAAGTSAGCFQLYKVVNATGKVIQARYAGTDLFTTT
jgi:hypothetical protein